MSRTSKTQWVCICLLWTAVWLGGLALLWPASIRIHSEPAEIVWVLWRREWIGAFRGFLIALNILGSLFLMWQTWKRFRFSLLPGFAILLAALLFPPLLMKDFWPTRLVSNLLLYVPPLILTLGVLPTLLRSSKESPEAEPRSVQKVSLQLTLAASLFFMMTGLAYTHFCGEHTGDEGHYIIQARSLLEDGDLDIQNQFVASYGEEELAWHLTPSGLERHLHISPASRHDRWYSFHTPGLSLVTWWTLPLGLWARHAVLGLIAGVGLGLLYALCRQVGALHFSSLLMTSLYAISIYAITYASRFLPEAMGATLVLALLVAANAQKKHPVISVLVGIFAVSFLPWGYLRFLPAAGLGAAYFVVFGVFQSEPWKRKGIRLLLFCAGSLLGLAVYRGFQLYFFEGGYSHPVQSLLMTYPTGIYRAFTDRRGFAQVFPLVSWLLPCSALAIFSRRINRLPMLACAFLFIVSWVIVCSGQNYGGGAALGGRFLVVVAPLLIPAAAWFWPRTPQWLKGWILFLGLLSGWLAVLQLVALPWAGKSFSTPYQSLPLIFETLWRWNPPWPDPTSFFFVCSVHAVLLLLLPLQKNWLRWVRVAVIAAGCVSLIKAHSDTPGVPGRDYVLHRRGAARQLQRVNLDQAWPDPDFREPVSSIYEVSDLLNDSRRPVFPVDITTEQLSAVHSNGVISQPLVPVNDWTNRPIRWVTLHAAFQPGEGRFNLLFEGTNPDRVPVRYALREGSKTLLEKDLEWDEEGRFKVFHTFDVQSEHSLLYILMNLSEEGRIHLEHAGCTPWGQSLPSLIHSPDSMPSDMDIPVPATHSEGGL